VAVGYGHTPSILRLLYYLPMEMTKKEEKKSELERLRDENRKLKDEFMLKLAEAFLLPPTSNQMAVYKQWNYSKWYDEVKYNMKIEIMDKLRPEFKDLEKQKDMLYRANRELTWLVILIAIILWIISVAYILK
jgi:hypothetical protein